MSSITQGTTGHIDTLLAAIETAKGTLADENHPHFHLNWSLCTAGHLVNALAGEEPGTVFADADDEIIPGVSMACLSAETGARHVPPTREDAIGALDWLKEKVLAA